MKPIDLKSNSYAKCNADSNAKDAKFKIGDHVRISKYKNIFAKGYAPNWSEEVSVNSKIKNTVPWTFFITLKCLIDVTTTPLNPCLLIFQFPPPEQSYSNLLPINHWGKFAAQTNFLKQYSYADCFAISQKERLFCIVFLSKFL